MTYRTTHAAELSIADIGATVRVAGWVNRRRDHGGVAFVDLRDASGVVQVVVDPAQHPEAGELRSEYCISVAGEVRARPEGTVNPDLPTGEIEVAAGELTVLSPSDPLPFRIDERGDVEELRRLEFRYLDLRRPEVAANVRARSAVVAAMRRTLEDRGFLDVETPTLVRSTPEGARDFLVPSRLRPGHFYALPQSPQLFKQLLMVGGIERYYQIARCYRDEDFRSDRQIEFTQLDLEGAFWGADDVLETLEAVMVAVVAATRGVAVAAPFPRITYAESMLRYGTDKPDTRFGMEISELSDLFTGTGFNAFAGVLGDGGAIRGFNAGGLGLSRAGLDDLVDRARRHGAKGLVWMVVEEDGSLRSPVAKFLTEAELSGLTETLTAKPGDLLLIVADRPRVVADVLGRLRLELGAPEGHEELRFLWVVDFPVFEETPDGDLVASHHPFTSPVDVAVMRERPAEAIAQAYDLVLNGSELGSGSVRIFDPAVQAEVFDILGISAAVAERRFGWFMRALRYGTPPHAGFGLGLDRLVAILQGAANIRQVIAFPKTQTGLDPMTESPTTVEEEQLTELGLQLRPEVVAALDEEEEPAPEG